jgi:hypothetical protein
MVAGVLRYALAQTGAAQHRVATDCDCPHYVRFRPRSRRASWLLLPYLLWVSFATYLNAAIVLLNPENKFIERTHIGLDTAPNPRHLRRRTVSDRIINYRNCTNQSALNYTVRDAFLLESLLKYS